jgi:cell division cycle protein 37
MIRWKQAQIHKERREREDQRDLLRMEYDTTEKFLEVLPEKIKSITILPPPVIPGFLSALGQEIDKSFTDPMRQESLKRMNNWNFTEPPVWGDVLRSHVPWNEEINSIMKKTEEYIEKEDDVANTSKFVLKLFDESFQKFKYRQSVILKQIKEFETTMSKKLTMDNLVTGFDKTFVAKDAIESVTSASSAEKSFKPATTKVIETIHSPKDSIKEPIIDEVFEFLALY